MDLDNLTKLCLRGSPLTPSPHPHTHTHQPACRLAVCIGSGLRTSGVGTWPAQWRNNERWSSPQAGCGGWGVGDTFHPFPGPAPSQAARGPAGGPALIPGIQSATARPRVNIGSNGTEYSGWDLTPGHPATNRPRGGGSGLPGSHSVIGRVSPAARRALASVVLHGVLNPWRFFDCARWFHGLMLVKGT